MIRGESVTTFCPYCMTHTIIGSCSIRVALLAGLVHVINKFRVKTLGLAPVRLGNKGPHLLAAHQVTISHATFHTWLLAQQ